MDSVKKDLYRRVGIYGSHNEDPVPEKVRRDSRIYRKKGGSIKKQNPYCSMKSKHKEY